MEEEEQTRVEREREENGGKQSRDAVMRGSKGGRGRKKWKKEGMN